MTVSEQEYLKALGRQIRALRTARGVGLEDLAEQADVHRTHLWKIEMGRLNTRLLTLRKIADELGVDVAELLTESPAQVLPNSPS